MNWINTVTYILTFGLILLIIVGLGIVVFFKFYRGRKGPEKEGSEPKGTKIADASSYVPVEYIDGNIMKIAGENRYVASLNCKGFDYFSVDEEEKAAAEAGYLVFVNTLDSPVTLRIDSAAVDLTNSIMLHEQIKTSTEIFLTEMYDRFSSICSEWEHSEPGKKAEYSRALCETDGAIKLFEWRQEYLAALIDYQKQMSGRDALPVQEERYIFEWNYDPSLFVGKPSDAEVLDRARRELAQKAAHMKDALSSAHVKARMDTEQDLFNLVYRHFHPYDSDTVRSLIGTNAEKRLVSNDRLRERAERKFRALEDKCRGEILKARDTAVDEGVSDSKTGNDAGIDETDNSFSEAAEVNASEELTIEFEGKGSEVISDVRFI